MLKNPKKTRATMNNRKNDKDKTKTFFKDPELHFTAAFPGWGEVEAASQGVGACHHDMQVAVP